MVTGNVTTPDEMVAIVPTWVTVPKTMDVAPVGAMITWSPTLIVDTCASLAVAWTSKVPGLTTSTAGPDAAEPDDDGDPTVEALALAVPPTSRLTAITVPLIGLTSFAPVRFCCAVKSALCADATDARSEAS